jgi:hypothetical protein
MMGVGGWSWCVCVVIARRSVCRDLSKQYHRTSILSPKLAAALPAAAATTKHELGRFLSATLRPPAFTSPKGPRMTTTTTSRSCTMTVVLHHANSHESHLLQPFHFFTDVLAGWQPLDIASSSRGAPFALCGVKLDVRTILALFAFEEQASRHRTTSATWECLATQGAHAMALSPHINLGHEWPHLRPPWP